MSEAVMITLKQWVCETAMKLGVGDRAIYSRLYRLRINYPPHVKVTARTILVDKNTPAIPREPHQPMPGETRGTDFIKDESRRTGLRDTAIYNRIRRGKYPNLIIRRVSKRMIFVKTQPQTERKEG